MKQLQIEKAKKKSSSQNSTGLDKSIDSLNSSTSLEFESLVVDDVAGLQIQLKYYKAIHKQLNSENSNLSSEISKLKQEITSLSSEYHESLSKFKDPDSEISMSTKINFLTTENNSLSASLKQLKNQNVLDNNEAVFIDKLRQNEASVQIKLNKVQEEVKNRDDIIDKLNLVIMERDQTIQKFMNTIAEKNAACKQLEADISTLKISHKSIIDNFEYSIAGLKSENSNLRLSLDSLQTEIIKRDTKCADQEKENHVENSVSSDASASLLTRINFLELELESTLEHCDSQTKLLAKAQHDLSCLRLSQANVGEVLLKHSASGLPIVATDLILPYQAKCEKLAEEILSLKSELSEAREKLDQSLNLVQERNVAVSKYNDARRDVEECKKQIVRLKESFTAKEHARAAVTAQLESDYRSIVTLYKSFQKTIWEMSVSQNWRSGEVPGISDRAELINIADWINWIIRKYNDLKEEVTHAHELVDIQHEKIENASFLNSQNDHESVFSFFQKSAVSLWAGFQSGISARNGYGSGSVYANNDKFRSNYRRDSASHYTMLSFERESDNFMINGHDQPSIDCAVSESEKKADVDISPGELSKLEAHKLVHTNKKLKESLSLLQQKYEYQVKTNSEIKKMMVGKTVESLSKSDSKSSFDENMWDKYNEALAEVGDLRNQMAELLAKYNEMEAVIEKVFLAQMSESTKIDD